jgi:hypothetical protein
VIATGVGQLIWNGNTLLRISYINVLYIPLIVFLLKESDTKKLNIPIMHILYTIISINCISSTDTLDLIIFLVFFKNTISGINNTFIQIICDNARPFQISCPAPVAIT